MANFRPYPILTALMLPALALLLWLGSWQLDRRAWKVELLAQYAATADAPPISLSEGVCEGLAETGRRVIAPRMDASAAIVRVSGRNVQGAPGWRLFSAVAACDGTEHVLVETGFEALQTATRADDGAVPAQPEALSLRFETPLGTGGFTPPPDVASNMFYAFDAVGMASVLGIEADALNTQYWLALSTGEPPAYLTQTPPERHLAYAITWFAMTLALLAVYFAYHIQAGRLTGRGA
ncbi:SURF1 family protein [Oceanicaulis sp.]|uniref:SURF1 family protein n=1 Tax=Oceanicaulis sp. TaxID=1924941 RepID=UPI003BA9763F